MFRIPSISGRATHHGLHASIRLTRNPFTPSGSAHRPFERTGTAGVRLAADLNASAAQLGINCSCALSIVSPFALGRVSVTHIACEHHLGKKFSSKKHIESLLRFRTCSMRTLGEPLRPRCHLITRSCGSPDRYSSHLRKLLRLHLRIKSASALQ